LLNDKFYASCEGIGLLVSCEGIGLLVGLKLYSAQVQSNNDNKCIQHH